MKQKMTKEFRNEAEPYEYIVLDLDGTRTNRNKVSRPDEKGPNGGPGQGKKVVLASGRPTQGVMPLAEELDLKANGGFIRPITAAGS